MEYVIEGILILALGLYILSPLVVRDRWQGLAKQNEASDETA